MKVLPTLAKRLRNHRKNRVGHVAGVVFQLWTCTGMPAMLIVPLKKERPGTYCCAVSLLSERVRE